MSRSAQRKPLSFSTTMRNPQRIAGFLDCLIPFENMTLTSEIIHQVIKKILAAKLYYTMQEKQDLVLWTKFCDEDTAFKDEELENIIEASPQQHKEAGFAAGWDSRFDTFYKLQMELGFVYYEMGYPVQISMAGHALAEAYKEKPQNNAKIQNIFLNALAKYQTHNPFRRNANRNVPLLLLLNVIRKLKEATDGKSAGVCRQELPLLICWPNNDYTALCKKIIRIRKKYGFSYSDEFIYGICLDLLGVTKEKCNRFKMSQICGEAVDEYVRKMRSTGIISLRGNGRFLDINSFESDKADYLIANYAEFNDYTDKKAYFEYAGNIDPNILETKETDETKLDNVRLKALHKFADEYSRQIIFDELKAVCRKRCSDDAVLKLIPEPVRFEFLTSIALVQNFTDLDVYPNYIVDDEGLPICPASGGKADIVCRDALTDSLFEVSLLCGGHEQMFAEIVPIKRHLLEYIKAAGKETFAVFVAPRVHRDTIEAVLLLKKMSHDSVDIVPLDIDTFVGEIQICENISMLREMQPLNKCGAVI